MPHAGQSLPCTFGEDYLEVLGRSHKSLVRSCEGYHGGHDAPQGNAAHSQLLIQQAAAGRVTSLPVTIHIAIVAEAQPHHLASIVAHIDLLGAIVRKSAVEGVPRGAISGDTETIVGIAGCGCVKAQHH